MAMMNDTWVMTKPPPTSLAPIFSGWSSPRKESEVQHPLLEPNGYPNAIAADVRVEVGFAPLVQPGSVGALAAKQQV